MAATAVVLAGSRPGGDPFAQNFGTDLKALIPVGGKPMIQRPVEALLDLLQAGRGGEIQLTDGLAQLVSERQVFGCEFLGDRYDIGDKFGFVRATVAYALKRPDLKDKVLEYIKSMAD